MLRILLVDDEKDTLVLLESLFLEHADEFAIESFTSPQAALQCAGNTSFDLAIVDFVMPEMDGVAFTKALWERQAETACIIMSGLSDREALINRVKTVLRSRQQHEQSPQQGATGGSNRRNILRFLNKPWNNVALIVLAAQALAFRRALQENRRLVATHGSLAKTESPPKHYQILVVDEQNAFGSVARGLNHQSPFHDLHGAMRHKSALESRRDTNDYRFIVETANSSDKALELAERISFDVVISDQGMAEMSNMDFLDKLRENHPHTPRLLLADKADSKTLINAFNQFGIFGYIEKHWGLHDIKNAVTQAIAFRKLLLENHALARQAANQPVAG